MADGAVVVDAIVDDDDDDECENHTLLLSSTTTTPTIPAKEEKTLLYKVKVKVSNARFPNVWSWICNVRRICNMSGVNLIQPRNCVLWGSILLTNQIYEGYAGTLFLAPRYRPMRMVVLRRPKLLEDICCSGVFVANPAWAI